MNDKINSQSVLVVDDDTLMREVLKAILRSEGFSVAGDAVNGEKGLAQSDVCIRMPFAWTSTCRV